jgi:hypothetical protein
MNFRIKYLIFGIVALLLFNIAGGINSVYFAGPQLWGVTFPISIVPNIFEEEIHWPKTVPDQFKFISGAFSGNKSKCNTILFHLKKNISGGTINMIIGKIDDIKYSEKCLKSIDKNYHSYFVNTPEKTTYSLSNTYVLYEPWTNFNTRLVPKGNCLNIYGIKKDTMYVQDIGENRAQIIEGEFDRIAFEVTPNAGIIRNYIKEIRFNGLQYGRLLLLHNNNGKFAFVLAHSYAADKQNISPYLDSLQKDLAEFKILK